jgi:putative flippase GtrA
MVALIKKYKELIIYAIVGVLTTLVDTATFWIFSSSLDVESTVLPSFLAWVCSVIFAFFANKLFVFESKSFAPWIFFKEFGSFTLARISTGLLNDILSDAIRTTDPPTKHGRRLKIYYSTQDGVSPPTFIIFVNNAELMHFSYKRFLENVIRKASDFSGTPIRLFVRERTEED